MGAAWYLARRAADYDKEQLLDEMASILGGPVLPMQMNFGKSLDRCAERPGAGDQAGPTLWLHITV